MPNDIYDHFSYSFRNPETWLHLHEQKYTAKTEEEKKNLRRIW